MNSCHRIVKGFIQLARRIAQKVPSQQVLTRQSPIMESAPITNGESSKRPRSASPVAGSPPSKKTTLSTDAASSENTKPEASEASSGPPVAAQVEDEESALNVNAASAGSKWNTKVNRKNDLPKGRRGKEWKGNKDKSDRDQSWHKGADQRKPKADGEAEEDGEGGKRLPKKKAAILIGYVTMLWSHLAITDVPGLSDIAVPDTTVCRCEYCYNAVHAGPRS